MSHIDRMENPVCPASLDEATLGDVEILECPYPTSELLREQAPVWRDPRTNLWVITRYEDLRRVCADTERYSNKRPSNDHANLTGSARKAYELFLEQGWVPGESLAARDDPEHKQMRAIFDQAFRPRRVQQLDPEVRDLAYRLIADFIDDGHCEFVRQFAVPLPLFIICRQMGANPDDVWQIKEWTDAWFQGVGFGLSEEQVLWATAKEIEAQHYFQAICRNAASHLGFSSGTHYCLGAPLARRELYWGFKAFIDHIEEFRLAPGMNDLRHHPNYALRALRGLHIEFTAKP
jgi:cytochrome P450